jgi:hypothetical protein
VADHAGGAAGIQDAHKAMAQLLALLAPAGTGEPGGNRYLLAG